MSWSEILIVAVVALIVVGPKDLPGMFREMGKFTAKAKRMAREFTRAMEDAADDAGIVDVQKTFKAATNPAKSALDSVTDTMREAVDFDAMDPESETAKLAAKKKADKDAAQARAKAVKDANAAAEAQAKDFAKKPAEPKKAAAKKSAAKKPAAKKPAAKKPAPAKVAKTKTATKTAAKKAPAKKAKSG